MPTLTRLFCAARVLQPVQRCPGVGHKPRGPESDGESDPDGGPDHGVKPFPRLPATVGLHRGTSAACEGDVVVPGVCEVRRAPTLPGMLMVAIE